jgi:hypothetical protein
MRPHNYSLPDADLHETYTDSYTNRTVNVESMDFTAPIFTRPQLLSGITWRESIPNFTKIGQEMWKERVEKSFNTLNEVWLSVDFHEIHLSCTSILWRTSIPNFMKIRKWCSRCC